MVRLFKGTCEAIRAMHDYRAPLGTTSRENQSSSARRLSGEQPARHSEDEEMFPHPDGDADGGFSYDGAAGGSSVPLMTKSRLEEEETIFDGDEELKQIQQNGKARADDGQSELVPYAHRDLKPGYVAFRDCPI